MSTFTPEEADLVEQHLLTAPGAAHHDGPLYPLPTATKQPLDWRLRRADNQVVRCRWCGAHSNKRDRLCDHCRANGYPVI